MSPERYIEDELVADASVIKIEQYPDKSIEALVSHEGQTYPLVWTASYGPSVINPDSDTLRQLLSVEDHPTFKNHTLLLPLQANGRCAADCRGCVFANHREASAPESIGRENRIASRVEPTTMNMLISKAVHIAEMKGLLGHGESFRVNPLLSGDPSYNRDTQQLILTIAAHERIQASRWSTIAAKTGNAPLEQFEQATDVMRAYGMHHKARFQVSLHSTQHEQRMEHVWHYSPTKHPLYSFEEIATSFSTIHSNTGYASTLAFVVHERSIIDPRVLKEHFSSENTWISLRPMIATDSDSAKAMRLQDFEDLYNSIREEGFTTVVMPTVNGIEQDNLNRGLMHLESH